MLGDLEGIKILTTADDVTEDIITCVIDCVDWFEDGPMPTEDFIDKLCNTYGAHDWDIEEYDCPAARKIMRIARAEKRDRA